MNVDGDARARRLRARRWLAQLKDALRADAGRHHRLAVARSDRTTVEMTVGELRSLARVTRGKQVRYIVDTRFIPDNPRVPLPVMHDATSCS